MYEKFEELLKKNKTNSSQVAKATGINRSTFSKWKKTGSTPNASTLIKIAEHFGVGLDYFYLDDAIREHNQSVDAMLDDIAESIFMATMKKYDNHSFSKKDISLIDQYISTLIRDDDDGE